MQLRTVYARFYKSFNYDYLRKAHPSAKPKAWEFLYEDKWFPYVEVEIEQNITAVVGANESGKSHLLSAIRKGLSGEGIEPEDICRYSEFFDVRKGKSKWPDFGFRFSALKIDEKTVLREACELEENDDISEFHFFRTNVKDITLYLKIKGKMQPFPLTDRKVQNRVLQILPRVFEINSNVALPDRVPINLMSRTSKESRGPVDREKIFAFYERFSDTGEWFANADAVKNNAPSIAALFRGAEVPTERLTQYNQEIALARDLLCKVANIDPSYFAVLYDTIKKGNDGHAQGLVQKINGALESQLNFPKVWVQDKNFQLIVNTREFDLVFTIQDRTRTQYSFRERSNGLKYFLSYYVQYLAHSPIEGQDEILLMDEPDAYLSSQAQQDLLKIFDSFAGTDDGRPPVQVIYVTHSPFLIDKNHAERIRVLDKGEHEEGTRVVKDVARNYYEPLRSALGALVGETTFIGHSNLLVEGISDQVLLAGMSTLLRKGGTPTLEILDLNRMTIAPAGSASEVPYLVYLARGRGAETPSVTVLLDSDQAGNTAVTALKRQGPHKKKFLDDKYILQIGNLQSSKLTMFKDRDLVDLEDLIPVSVCAEAVCQYAREVMNASEEQISSFTIDALQHEVQKLDKKSGIFKAIEQCVKAKLGETFHIEKSGFARSVVDVMNRISRQSNPGEALSKGADIFRANMRVLFYELNRIQRLAETERSREKISQKIKRTRKGFFQNHPNSATYQDAVVLLESIELELEDDRDAEAVKNSLHTIRRDFNLSENPTDLISNYGTFKERMNTVVYGAVLAAEEQAHNSDVRDDSEVGVDSG